MLLFRKHFALVVLCVLLFSTVVAQAPSPAERKQLLADSVKAAKEYVSTVRPQVFRTLTGRERSIYDEIEFEVTADDSAWESNGGIDPDGTRKITVDVGYFRNIEILTDAIFLE